MRISTKVRWLLAILVLMSTTMFAQVPQNVNLNEGVLRVKLKPELSKAAAKARLRSGNLTVGHSQFDAASKSVKAYRLERVFPYNEKYDRRAFLRSDT